VTERRQALGLSAEDLASRAGMDVAYVRRLETTSSAQLSREALRRLALALDTTVDALSGGGGLAPPGRTDPSGRPFLADIDPGECWPLIAPGGVGRVVFVEERGPVALPVNFRMLEHDVVFRTEASSALMHALSQGTVSFEVDNIDDALAEGWSVLLSGVGHLIEDPEERQVAESLGVGPWAGGERNIYVRIVSREISGRRIRRA
jgi:transcriptional regulator with XRE-family HTH domain